MTLNQILYNTPEGEYSALYADMLKQPHLLVAGATGSGKSVVINGIIATALYNSPAIAKFILIDPKRVELIEYKNLPHTMVYASEPEDMINALKAAMDITEARYMAMQRKGVKKYTGSHLYVIIDELADLMTTNAKEVTPLIQRLCQIGRAARVHVLAATQRPTTDIIGGKITCNIDARVGLHTRNAQDSRNILGENGCEKLPRYGQGYYMTPEQFQLYNIPMIPETEIARLIEYWK